MKPFIEFMTLCYNYQRRWVWQLSTLLQQDYLPENLLINIAYVRGNGNPSTESIIEFYREKGLKIKETVYQDLESMAWRNKVRDRQLETSEAEWVYFGDPDHIFAPDFWRELCLALQFRSIRCGCVFSSNKKNTDEILTQTAIDMQGESLYVESAYQTALDNLGEFLFHGMPYYGKHTAGGCMQIVKKEWIDKCNGGKYSVPGVEDRHLFGQRTWSDKAFRSKFGRPVCLKLPMQIHLNHARKKQSTYNPEAQK